MDIEIDNKTNRFVLDRAEKKIKDSPTKLQVPGILILPKIKKKKKVLNKGIHINKPL